MSQLQSEQIRILHIIGRMRRAGAEMLLMNVLRNSDPARLHMDFLVHSNEPGDFDEEIRARGGKCIVCPMPSPPHVYAHNLKRILREHGPYDVVHSHVHHFSGYVLRIAKQAGVPGRIAHSHNDLLSDKPGTSCMRRVYVALTRRWINQYANAGIAVSPEAAGDLFGARWQSDPRWRIVQPGIEIELFTVTPEPAAMRAQLGIPDGAVVVGHVGRFEPQKNHPFIIEIASELVKLKANSVLLLVGDGDMRAQIEQQACDLGIRDKVIFAGVRSDIARLMISAMDVLILPSLYEGLGLVLVEAQAAGLPCVVTDSITRESQVVEPLMHWVSLQQQPSVWAEEILAAYEGKQKVSRQDALGVIADSRFNIKRCVSELEGLYYELCRAE